MAITEAGWSKVRSTGRDLGEVEDDSEVGDTEGEIGQGSATPMARSTARGRRRGRDIEGDAGDRRVKGEIDGADGEVGGEVDGEVGGEVAMSKAKPVLKGEIGDAETKAWSTVRFRLWVFTLLVGTGGEDRTAGVSASTISGRAAEWKGWAG